MVDWQRVVDEHGAVVWTTAARLLGNSTDAEDCFQATFLSAWKIAQSEHVRSWASLLRRIATCRALEILRQRMRSTNRVTTAECDDHVDHRALPPETMAASNELASQLRAALAELDSRQAEVFCLACLEGMSYREIAERLELSVNHVGVLLNRARAVLREQLVPRESPGSAVVHKPS